MLLIYMRLCVAEWILTLKSYKCSPSMLIGSDELWIDPTILVSKQTV